MPFVIFFIFIFNFLAKLNSLLLEDDNIRYANEINFLRHNYQNS